jgi:hypothetical protein
MLRRAPLVLVPLAFACAAACFDWSTPDEAPMASDGGIEDAPPSDAPADADGGASDCPSCTVVEDDLAGPITGLAASPDGHHIYWIGSLDAGAWVRDDDGGVSIVGADSHDLATRIAAADVDFFLATSNNILRLPRDGGASNKVSPSSVNPSVLVFAPPGLSALFWASGVTLYQCSEPQQQACAGAPAAFQEDAASPAPVVATAGLGDYAVFAAIDGTLYRTPSGDLVDAVGGATATAIAARGGAASHDDEILWAVSSADGGTIRRRLDGGGDAGELSVGAVVTTIVFTDRDGGADAVYATRRADGAFDLARVVNTLDAAPRTFATAQQGVTQIVVGSDGIYFTRQRGTVWQLVRSR